MKLLKKEFNCHYLQINVNNFEYYENMRGRAFDLNFENEIKINKKEFLKNTEVKKHKELKKSFVKNIGNVNLCKINNKWVRLNMIKNIDLQEFFLYQDSGNFIKISNLEKTEFLVISPFNFNLL